MAAFFPPKASVFVYDNLGGRYRIKYLTGQFKSKTSSQGVTEASKQSVREFHSLQLLVCSDPGKKQIFLVEIKKQGSMITGIMILSSSHIYIPYE